MLKGKKLKLARSITGDLVEKTLTAPFWVMAVLLELGIASMEVFLNPSIYNDPFPHIIENFALQENIKNIKKKKKIKEATIRQSLWRLRKHGFVEKRKDKYILTKAGRLVMDYVIKRRKTVSKKWDGKYRVVIFDIPEKDRKMRDWLRQELYFMEYQKLQESVFIGKYPLPANLIKDLKRNKIGNYVNYLLVDKVYKNIINS